ncbi:hypothetical protein, partial [Eggerthella sinensis]|uniref:hypothetical protein n=1 Tax=Eggerthella sinensis TaxID=242230 RepID=UPI0022E6678C
MRPNTEVQRAASWPSVSPSSSPRVHSWPYPLSREPGMGTSTCWKFRLSMPGSTRCARTLTSRAVVPGSTRCARTLTSRAVWYRQ